MTLAIFETVFEDLATLEIAPEIALPGISSSAQSAIEPMVFAIWDYRQN